MPEREHDLLEAIDAIDPALCSYEEWVQVGMALKDAGHHARDWDTWSRRDSRRYHEGECEKKWASFRGSTTPVTGGTIVAIARAQGWRPPADEGHELSWDDIIGPRDEKVIIPDTAWVEAEEVPEPVSWDPVREIVTYLSTLFSTEENVGYVAKAWEKDGRYMPQKGNWDRTAGELINELNRCAGDIGRVFGDVDPEVGAWIRFNPLDGQGCKNDNVTEFRYALVESDTMPIDKQNAIIRRLELPVACLVHSGGKSLHAIVRIDAPTYDEYRKRVDYLYDVCRKNGLAIDVQNKNPSRLSRLPGVVRNGHKQFLVATNIGRENWNDWLAWIEASTDDLPEPENLSDVWEHMPDLSAPLIDGVLRQGHKMLLAGPSKAGKSYALIELAIAIAEGRKWYSWQCTQGRVLYVNLELDRASCLHRFKDVYRALGWHAGNLGNVDTWNLRGKSTPMDRLAPKLIRRAASKGYIAIVIDPIYKVITGDENSADQMARFCNQFDLVAAELGCAVIYCHHHSKGSQGQKRSADRASGSGVFARDPDTLLDLIELELTEDVIRQQVNDRACEHMRAWMIANAPQLTEDIGPDTQASETAFRSALAAALSHERMNALIGELAAVEARTRTITAWRIEGTLREFPKFPPVNLWFEYPVHTIDEVGVLADLDADGIVPIQQKAAKKRSQKAAKERRQKASGIDDAVANANFGEPPTTAQAMTYLGLDPREKGDKLKFDRMLRDNGRYVRHCDDRVNNVWTIHPRGASDADE